MAAVQTWTVYTHVYVCIYLMLLFSHLAEFVFMMHATIHVLCVSLNACELRLKARQGNEPESTLLFS